MKKSFHMLITIWNWIKIILLMKPTNPYWKFVKKTMVMTWFCKICHGREKGRALGRRPNWVKQSSPTNSKPSHVAPNHTQIVAQPTLPPEVGPPLGSQLMDQPSEVVQLTSSRASRMEPSTHHVLTSLLHFQQMGCTFIYPLPMT